MLMTSGLLADYWKKLFDDGLFGFGVSYEGFYREDFQVKKKHNFLIIRMANTVK